MENSSWDVAPARPRGDSELSPPLDKPVVDVGYDRYIGHMAVSVARETWTDTDR